METDEQVPAEETAAVSPETNSELNDSEVVPTDETENTSKGDLRVPLKQTREELRALREKLDDPNFIFERAKGLGLTEPETEFQPSVTPEVDVSKQVQIELSKERALEKYPELRTNEGLQYAVTAYMNKGMLADKAADKVFADIKKLNEKAAQEAAEEEKQATQAQEAAQTISSTSEKTADDAEFDKLYQMSKSRDPRVQKKAMIELERIKFIRGQK